VRLLKCKPNLFIKHVLKQPTQRALYASADWIVAPPPPLSAGPGPAASARGERDSVLCLVYANGIGSLKTKKLLNRSLLHRAGRQRALAVHPAGQELGGARRLGQALGELVRLDERAQTQLVVGTDAERERARAVFQLEQVSD